MVADWRKRYLEAYQAWQRRDRSEKSILEHGYVLIKNYPNVETHTGFEQATENYLKWIDAFCQNTPTVGGAKYEGVLIGGKLQKVITGRHYAKGGRGKQDIEFIINGITVRLELKVKKDTQSDKQRQYQERVERSQGIYIIIRTMHELYHICDLCLSGHSLTGLKFYEK